MPNLLVETRHPWLVSMCPPLDPPDCLEASALKHPTKLRPRASRCNSPALMSSTGGKAVCANGRSELMRTAKSTHPSQGHLSILQSCLYMLICSKALFGSGSYPMRPHLLFNFICQVAKALLATSANVFVRIAGWGHAHLGALPLVEPLLSKCSGCAGWNPWCTNL